MTRLEKPLVAIVQHSGYGYGEKPGFAQGVETRIIRSVGELNKIRRAGGIAFSNHAAADEFCMQIMYEHAGGLYPYAQGSFSSQMIDQLRIYQPTPEDRKRAQQIATEFDCLIY